MKLESMRVFSCKHPLLDVISPFIRILNLCKRANSHGTRDFAADADQ